MGRSGWVERTELDAGQPPSAGQFDPYLTEPDGQRHRVTTPGGLAALDTADDRGVVVAAHVQFGRLQGPVSEISVPGDPLPFVKLEAPLADRDEVIGQEGAQAAGVGVQLGVVERLLEFADVGYHLVILSPGPPGSPGPH
jgi:hypothetical protein